MNLVHELEVKVKRQSVNWLEKYFSGDSIDYKQIFAIILPIFVDQAFLILMSFLNTAMISSAGVAAVSAVSMVDSLNIFLINVFIAVATGGTVIVAQYMGSGNKAMVSKTATQAISAVTIVSVLITVLVMVFNHPVLNLLFGKAEADVFQNAKLYLIGSCISYPLIAVFQAVCGSLRGMGDTKPCLNLSLFMNLTNTVLNVLLITIFHMGVMGLVISIILARLLGMVASLIYIINKNKTIHFRIKDAVHLDYSILKKIMYIGLPFAAEQLFFNGGKLLTQTFIVQLGTMAITAYAIANSISLLFQMGPSSLSISAVTIVGQCMGRRSIGDARKFTKSLIGLSSILFLVTSLLLLPFFPEMMKLFSAPEEIIPTIYTLTIMAAFGQPILWASSFIMPSALRAAGDSNYTSVTSLLSMWLIRVVLGYVLGITLGFGIIGVWAAMIIEWVVRGTIFYRRFKGEKWHAHRLI
ncbi:MATE family efflux transporter [Bacillus benzoevorans]|uniref:Probable multidrug resistance protein NorM n=1 Tax=Bacillus benzoevorans TaxID=1456 RepID=A0A7X0LW53_9BACI|nr:putative MATE family efflux protein [Bacillus benzoevorans]